MAVYAQCQTAHDKLRAGRLHIDYDGGHVILHAAANIAIPAGQLGSGWIDPLCWLPNLAVQETKC